MKWLNENKGFLLSLSFCIFIVWFAFSPEYQRWYIRRQLGDGAYWRINQMPKLCWVNSLELINELKDNPDIVGIAHCTGYRDKSLEGHSWIEYGIKTEEGVTWYAYDPTFDRIITYKNVDMEKQ